MIDWLLRMWLWILGGLLVGVVVVSLATPDFLFLLNVASILGLAFTSITLLWRISELEKDKEKQDRHLRGLELTLADHIQKQKMRDLK